MPDACVNGNVSAADHTCALWIPRSWLPTLIPLDIGCCLDEGGGPGSLVVGRIHVDLGIEGDRASSPLLHRWFKSGRLRKPNGFLQSSSSPLRVSFANVRRALSCMNISCEKHTARIVA